jgi:hypothetical protein
MMHLLHLASSSQLITLWAVEMMQASKLEIVGSSQVTDLLPA